MSSQTALRFGLAAAGLAATGVVAHNYFDPTGSRTNPYPVEKELSSSRVAALVPNFFKGSNTSYIDKYGKDLTQKAREGKLKTLIGRDEEVTKLAKILALRDKPNALLIGNPGVGKTAIVEGLALKIIRGEVPPSLQNKRIVSLTMTSLTAGTIWHGQFEGRMNKIVEEMRLNPDIILFIDEVHTIMGAGYGSASGVGTADCLKPALARGEFRMIGATTPEEGLRIKRDKALARRFNDLIIHTPSIELSIEILEGLKTGYEEHHGVLFSSEALKAAVELSARYISDQFFPDKAIGLLDKAGAAHSVNVSALDRIVASDDQPAVGRKEILQALADTIDIPIHELERKELKYKFEQNQKRKAFSALLSHAKPPQISESVPPSKPLSWWSSMTSLFSNQARKWFRRITTIINIFFRPRSA